MSATGDIASGRRGVGGAACRNVDGCDAEGYMISRGCGGPRTWEKAW